MYVSWVSALVSVSVVMFQMSNAKLTVDQCSLSRHLFDLGTSF